MSTTIPKNPTATPEPLAVGVPPLATGSAFEPNSNYAGYATAMRCSKTGHEYVVLAPSVEALEGVLVIRCGIEPENFTRDRFRNVKLKPLDGEKVRREIEREAKEEEAEDAEYERRMKAARNIPDEPTRASVGTTL